MIYKIIDGLVVDLNALCKMSMKMKIERKDKFESVKTFRRALRINVVNKPDSVLGDLMAHFDNKIVIKLIRLYSAKLIKIPDVNCGFRSIKKKCAEEFMELYPNGFSISTTITLAMVKAGYSIKYIPIQVHPRKGRKSTVKQGPDGMRTLLLILRCIVLFNPLKVFAPISAFLFTFGCVFTLYSLFLNHNVSNSAIIILLSALIIFFFGLIADQLSVIRRSVK